MPPVQDFCLFLLDGLIIPFFLLIHRNLVLCLNGLKTHDCEIKESFPLKVFLGGVGGGDVDAGAPSVPLKSAVSGRPPPSPGAAATCACTSS